MQIFIFVVLLVVCILFSAFFSGAEIALSTLGKITVKQLKEQHKKRGKRLETLFKKPSRWLITILIGNNLANIAAASLATLLVSKLVGGAAGKTLAIVTGGMTFVILILGEITPKKYCREHSRNVALKVAGPILFLSVVLSPVIKVLSLFTRGIFRIVKVKQPEKQKITEEYIHTVIDIGQEEGAIDEREEELVHSALEFDDTKVKGVMTPRTQIVCIEQDSSLEELKNLIKKEDYSRIPVYQQSRDNIVGVVHIKDLLEKADKAKCNTVKEIMRSPIFVPYTTPLSVVLRELKKERTHLAVVVDEYGGVAGMVTMEDLLEEIVGEIEDEYKHDNGEEIKIQKDGSAIVRGETDIDEINEKLNISLPENSDVFKSIGGFIEDRFGRIPQEGEMREYGSIKIEILESDQRRIKRVKITKRKEDSGEKV